MNVFIAKFTLDNRKCQATVITSGQDTGAVFEIEGIENQIGHFVTSSRLLGSRARRHPKDEDNFDTAVRLCLKRALIETEATRQLRDTGRWFGAYTLNQLGRKLYDEFRHKQRREHPQYIEFQRMTSVEY